jgi:hypothetical protein
MSFLDRAGTTTLAGVRKTVGKLERILTKSPEIFAYLRANCKSNQGSFASITELRPKKNQVTLSPFELKELFCQHAQMQLSPPA